MKLCHTHNQLMLTFNQRLPQLVLDLSTRTRHTHRDWLNCRYFSSEFQANSRQIDKEKERKREREAWLSVKLSTKMIIKRTFQVLARLPEQSEVLSTCKSFVRLCCETNTHTLKLCGRQQVNAHEFATIDKRIWSEFRLQSVGSIACQVHWADRQRDKRRRCDSR